MTIAAFLFLLKRIGFFFYDNWRELAILAGIAGVLVASMFVYRSCGRPAKLNEQQIQRAEAAVKQRNDAELKQVLVEADVDAKRIDANVATAKAQTVNEIAESKKKYENMSLDELAAEFERRKNQ